MSDEPPRTLRFRSATHRVTMSVRLIGRRGRPVLYVPSSGGDHTEFERYGMAAACAPWLRSGRIRVVAVDGLARATLWNDALPPARRMAAYTAVEGCVRDEVLPRVAGRERAPVAVIGCSYGAFMATNLWCARPAAIDVVCGLGGVYGLWHRLDDYRGDDVTAHTPLDYVPALADPALLAAVRATRGIDLYAAADDEWLDSSLRLRDALVERDLPHTCEVWPAPADHHERWWRRQLVRFLRRRFPLD